MRQVLTMLCLLSMVDLHLAWGEEILSMYVGPTYARKYSTVSSSAVTCAAAERSLRILRSRHPGRQLYLIRLCAASRSCPMGFESSGPVPYDALLRLRERQLSTPPLIAEAISTPIGSLVRIRNIGGDVERCVQDADPLQVLVGQTVFSVAWMEYNEAQSESLSLFATVHRRVSQEEVTSAYQKMMKRFPATAVMLQVSDRPWFPGLTSFPAFYPFDQTFVPPSEEDLNQTGGVACYAIPEPKCSTFGSWKH